MGLGLGRQRRATPSFGWVSLILVPARGHGALQTAIASVSFGHSAGVVAGHGHAFAAALGTRRAYTFSCGDGGPDDDVMPSTSGTTWLGAQRKGRSEHWRE